MKWSWNDASSRRRAWQVAAPILAACWFATAATARAQLDICQCTGSPNNLGDFRSSDPDTYPPGTMTSGTTRTIPLPEDGTLIFDSFTLDAVGVTVKFAPNSANDPARILVTGNVAIVAGAIIDVRGSVASAASENMNSLGGLGGPGGFRGGDGSVPHVTLSTSGGAGLGPGGGDPGIPDLPDGSNAARNGTPGRFVSGGRVAFIGGSGGGGGSTTDVEGRPCRSAGGTGGAGALLIAANGTIDMNGTLIADGLAGTGVGDSFCAGTGGAGAPGAIRLVAERITGGGTLRAVLGSAEGEIRLEAFNIDFPGASTPQALRSFSPGPVFPPAAPRVAITSVSGESISIANDQPISELPQGVFGTVDVIVNSFDPVAVSVASQNVPEGTGVTVSAKRAGGAVIEATGPLENCDLEFCTALVSLELPPGTYFLEAQATFRAAP